MHTCHCTLSLPIYKPVPGPRTAFLAFALLLFIDLNAQQSGGTNEREAISVVFEPVHPWRPPFGFERVGRSVETVITANENQSEKELLFSCLINGKEISRKIIQFKANDSTPAREIITESADEIVISEKDNGGWKELLRKKPVLPAFEFEAIARPAQVIHPVDLGAILVPANWLLLNPQQKAFVDVAVICRERGKTPLEIRAWFASDPKRISRVRLSALSKTKIIRELLLPPASPSLKNDMLHVTVSTPGGKERWRKTINVMLCEKLKDLPAFGAIKTKLRYDVPITNIVDGKNQPFSYDSAWAPEKEDYIILLPNGSRWVFWRGASYIPVWASKYNTGLSYEWAERISPNEGFTDCPEPLMDKDLRYGKVDIIESTPARVHVRWSYQSCDFNYKVNGDFAYEDYYFYPDGFGTRVLTLTSIPNAEYEVAEFILLAPTAAIPFDVMPDKPMDIISYKTGKSQALTLPESDTTWKTLSDPIIYRMKLHKKEPLSAFSFNPLLVQKPFPFKPFRDKGLIVTPAYWGGHWPLSQGFNTGWAINESIWSGPSHNSLITWGPKRPAPIRSKSLQVRDALGVMKTMKEETWVWLIGMTDASNDSLLKAAKSFAQPPSLTIKGARQEPDGYASERRALKLIAEDKKIEITIQPQDWCINPVFEIRNTGGKIKQVTLDGENMRSDDYAWDGTTLWIKAGFQNDKTLGLEFE